MNATTNNIALAETVQYLCHPVVSTFEEELNSSWVYQRSRRRRARARPFSIASSAQLTQTWSLVSGLSLSGISNLSVWALPIQKEDLINSDMYWSENGQEFKISSGKEWGSTIDDHLPQILEVPELKLMFMHSGEEEQAPDEKHEACESLSQRQPEMSATTSVNEVAAEDFEEYPVLYVAKSLINFHLKVEKKYRRSYVWLVYDVGDVFDILGEKGDLWLAANQNDPLNKVGWLWSKNFAQVICNGLEHGVVLMRNIPLGDGDRIRQTIQEDDGIQKDEEI